VLAISAGAGLLLVGLGVVVVTKATGIILFGALVAEAIGRVVLFVVERRRHW